MITFSFIALFRTIRGGKLGSSFVLFRQPPFDLTLFARKSAKIKKPVSLNPLPR